MIRTQEQALKRRIFDVADIMHPLDQKCQCGTFLGNALRCPICKKLSKRGKQEETRRRLMRARPSIQRRMLEAMTGNVR